MKDLSKKQVIIPMSNNNKTKFIESLSSHITNLNQAYKVTLFLNLQTIEKYVKNTTNINSKEVKTLYVL